jgi:hypothetical protein
MSSKASMAFDRAIKTDVQSLIKQHEQDANSPGRPANWLKAERRAAVVLLAASLEYFVEDVVCEGFRFLVDQGIMASAYPRNLRLWLFKQSIVERNLSTPRDISQPEIVLSLYERLWSSTLRLEEKDLRLELVRQEFDNPTTKNINWIMGLLDFQHYLNGIPAIRVNQARVVPESAIHELSNRRNNIAHGNTDEDPDVDRVKFLLKFSKLFSNRIDKDVREKIYILAGNVYPWT